MTERSNHAASLPLSQKLQDRALAANMSGVAHTVFVMSGKGGVGKSSVTVNVAVALAEQGYRVGILDVDLHGPSVPRLLGLEGPILADESGKMQPVVWRDRLKVLSMDSFLQDRDTAILWRGPKKTAAIRQFLTDVEWGELDFLFIDSPPGTGDEHMTVLDALPEATCLVVTTPQEISLADVRKALDFLGHVEAPVLGIVENMSGLVCPHCGGVVDVYGKGGGKALAEAYDLPFLGAVVLDPAAVVAADRGLPAVLLEGDPPVKAAFMAIAREVARACGCTTP